MKKREMFYAERHPLYLKLLRIMKLTVALIIFACLQVSAKTYSQDRITLNLQSTEIKKVLAAIEKKSNYRFLYNDALLAGKPKVDVNVTNEEITNVLDDLFVNSGIGYKVLEHNLVVLKASNNNVPIVVIDKIVTGRVTDAAGQPLAGVSVTIKGSQVGVSTDASGNYSITVPDDNARLVFSYVGFDAQEMLVGTNSTVNITLQPSSKAMDQVIVVGYGTQRKIDVTGAVGTVRGEEISKQASVNPISALQGKVAGVQITNSGAPGSSPQIRIRGLGTVYGNANPLYIVDGVWLDDIAFLNPADIENVSILKDASSESIYGIRAANGVVLITTKKGRSGQTIVNYNGYAGWQTVTNQIEMANANEFATLVNELSVANGGSQVLNPADFSEGTDWYHHILRSAFITNHQVSVSGGSDRSTYNFSLGYLNQDGLVEGNNFKRYTARLQNDFQVAKPLKLGYSIIGAFTKSEDVPGSIWHQLYAAAPVVPVYYADGTYGDPSDYNLGDGANFNPQVTLDFYNQESKNYRLTGSVFGDLKFAKYFTLHSSVGGEYSDAEVRNYNPVYAATLKQRNTTSVLTLTKGNVKNWIIENTLTYDRRFGDHSVKVLAGQSAQSNQFYESVASAPNVPNNSEGDLYLRLGSTAGRNVTDKGTLATYTSYFGRINYSFKNRYLINASLRADGSSKFTGDERWGNFPSIGVGWVISDESFMENQKLFNNLKFRGSWGRIGNASVPSNISVLRVAQDPYLTAVFGGNLATGASINSVVPPTTFWEKGEGTDIGLEATILGNKMFIEVDYYKKKTIDAIFDIPILSSVGTSSGTIIGNQATFQNQGWEFTATWRDKINEMISYTISGNFSTNDNKVLEVTTGSNPIYGGGAAATGGQLATRTVVGQPIGQFYGYQVIGVFQSSAEVASYVQPNAKPGDFKFADLSGAAGKPDGKIDGNDRIALGNPNPKYYYGLNTNWAYKQFDLTLDFQGVAGVEVYNANLGLRFGNENWTKDFFDNRWHGQGTSNSYPSANIGGGDNYRPNSFYVEDGSYFRVRNLQLGYTLPTAMTNRWYMKKLRVYANAQNAFNFFSYRGFTPEIGGTPINAGIDANVYPIFATYNFGVNVTF